MNENMDGELHLLSIFIFKKNVDAWSHTISFNSELLQRIRLNVWCCQKEIINIFLLRVVNDFIWDYALKGISYKCISTLLSSVHSVHLRYVNTNLVKILYLLNYLFILFLELIWYMTKNIHSIKALMPLKNECIDEDVHENAVQSRYLIMK